jgi:hypothetical protein
MAVERIAPLAGVVGRFVILGNAKHRAAAPDKYFLAAAHHPFGPSVALAERV